MFKHFINLQWKSFFRSASFKTEIWFKILMAFGMAKKAISCILLLFSWALVLALIL